MPRYRSRATTHGRNMAGAHCLWRATAMTDGDWDKPIIAIFNSFTHFVPGHVHLKDLRQMVAREVASGLQLGVHAHLGPTDQMSIQCKRRVAVAWSKARLGSDIAGLVGLRSDVTLSGT